MSKYKKDIVGNSVTSIYASLFTILLTDSLGGHFIPSHFLRFFELICLAYAFYHYFKLRRRGALIVFPGSVKIVYYAFVGITIGMVLRANWNLGMKDLIMLLISRGNTLVYLCPLLLLRLPNREYADDIFKLFYKVCLFVIPIWLININGLILVNSATPWAGESIGQWVPFLSAFLLGLTHKFPGNKKFFIYAIWFVYLILMLLNARRNVSFTLMLYFAIAYIYKFFVYASSSRRLAKVVMVCAGGLLVFLNIDYLLDAVFANMGMRLTNDTRTGVEESFFLDFYNAPYADWIWGRGMEGEYYCLNFNENIDEMAETRGIIETGYLQMLLKGGLAYIAVVLIFIVKASRSLLKKNVNDSYFIGIILLTYLIDNEITNPICVFNPRAILFWFIISYAIGRSKTSVLTTQTK